MTDFILPFQFHLYGFFVGLGGVVAISISEFFFKKEKISLNFNILVIVVIVSSLIGARAYHVITDWKLYESSSILDLFAVWNGGIGIIGALIGGFAGIMSYLLFQHKLKYLVHILDILALALPFSQAIGRWGNYFNQELYGTATDLPWGISISETHLPDFLDSTQKYHPLFLYESLSLLVLGIILHGVYSNKEKFGKLGTGKYLAVYACSYGCTRFLLEFLRPDSSRPHLALIDFFTTAQWFMLGLVIIGVLILLQTKNKKAEI